MTEGQQVKYSDKPLMLLTGALHTSRRAWISSSCVYHIFCRTLAAVG